MPLFYYLLVDGSIIETFRDPIMAALAGAEAKLEDTARAVVLLIEDRELREANMAELLACGSAS